MLARMHQDLMESIRSLAILAVIGSNMWRLGCVPKICMLYRIGQGMESCHQRSEASAGVSALVVANLIPATRFQEQSTRLRSGPPAQATTFRFGSRTF